MNQTIPREISNAAAALLSPYAPGLTAERLAEAITYQPEAESERYYTRRQTSEKMTVSLPTVDRMLRSGQLPKRRIRGAVRVPASAVEAILNGKAVA